MTRLDTKNFFFVIVFIILVGVVVRITLSAKSNIYQTESLAPIETDPVSLLETKPLDNPNAEDRVSTDSSVISYREAWNHIGEKRIVEGVLQHVFNSGKATILGFKDHHRGETKVRILQEHYSSFQGDPELLYKVGDRIQVTGKIEWYQGDPVIYVSDPSQITIDKN